MKRVFLTPPQPSRNPQASSTLPTPTTRTFPFFRSHSTPDNMPRAANTSDSPKHRVAYRDWYVDWCKERKPHGLPCNRKLAGKAWRKISEDDRAGCRAQPHETPESLHVTEPIYYSDEDEDFVNDVVSLNPSPVKEVEQLPLSPLFSDVGPDVGPSIFNEFHAAGPSVLDQCPSTGPRGVALELPFQGPSSVNELPLTGPSFNAGQFSFVTPSPSVNGPPIDSPPEISPSTPVPSHSLPTNNVVNQPDFSLLDEVAYTYQASLPPTHELTFPEYNFWDEAPYDPIPTGVHQLDLPTPVPTTPVTGYNALQTPWYTPGLRTHDLPTGLDDTRFPYNNAEAPAVPEQQQQTWNNNYESSECFPQLSVEPPTNAPVLAPDLAPAPEIGGQFDQTAGFQGDPYQWNGVANVQMFENDQLQNNQLQIPPAPVFNQNLPLAAVQQVFNSVNVNGLGQEGKRLGLVGVQLWFVPT